MEFLDPFFISDANQSSIRSELERDSLSPDPMVQFRTWYEESMKANIKDPNAMVLSTVSSEGMPCSRVVLLKVITNDSLVFFTNYRSRKAKQIEQYNDVALNFHWKELERQVRIEGKAYHLNRKDSEAYFSTRPIESKIGAWASPQSEVIPNREWLETEISRYKASFDESDIPCPPFWGGFYVKPFIMEFWQSRESRLHDRFQYKFENEAWIIERLAP
jgi:pyridoxamine 5'-phosphate oxidase